MTRRENIDMGKRRDHPRAAWLIGRGREQWIQPDHKRGTTPDFPHTSLEELDVPGVPSVANNKHGGVPPDPASAVPGQEFVQA